MTTTTTTTPWCRCGHEGDARHEHIDVGGSGHCDVCGLPERGYLLGAVLAQVEDLNQQQALDLLNHAVRLTHARSADPEDGLLGDPEDGDQTCPDCGAGPLEACTEACRCAECAPLHARGAL